jgi:hypothetical protein
MFIFITDQELCARELISYIIGYNHSLSLKEILNQFNLIYICIYLYLQQIKSYSHVS